ncbi:MAG: hypothetical protein OQJ81_08210, partial [Melioribacteraceae bacterium]|nr:hypothetical protein [Melioribacteraceae bacterium]
MKKLIGILGTQIILFFFNSSFELLISSSGSGQIIKLVNKTITLKVLLVEFQDVKHRSPEYPKSLALPAYTYNDFENLFFSENQYCSPRMYSPDGEKVFGSLRDYYRIMSNNTLGIEGYILNRDLNNDNIPDWIMLDNNKSYYNNNRGNIFRDEAKEKAKKIGLNLDVDKNNFVVIIYAGQTYRPKILNSLRPSANYDKHEYIMGERFVGHAPYDEERDDVTKNKISHFSHIGIHAHEFAHLLGCYDL